MRSPIRGIFIGDEITAIKGGLQLKKMGYLTNVATYPTTKNGNCIIRICISADHSDEDILQLCKSINQVLMNLSTSA